jgi:ureidoglycolate lyase
VEFAPFGRVIEVGAGVSSNANQGTATRYDFCTDLITTRPQARLNLAVFRAEPRAMPLTLKLLERHPCSTQVFVPMAVSRYLVCVAPTAPDGGPELSGLRAFVCTSRQAVAYAPGVWHHPMAALDAPSDFTMLAWEDGTSLDCEVRELPETAWRVVTIP